MNNLFLSSDTSLPKFNMSPGIKMLLAASVLAGDTFDVFDKKFETAGLLAQLFPENDTIVLAAIMRNCLMTGNYTWDDVAAFAGFDTALIIAEITPNPKHDLITRMKTLASEWTKWSFEAQNLQAALMLAELDCLRAELQNGPTRAVWFMITSRVLLLNDAMDEMLKPSINCLIHHALQLGIKNTLKGFGPMSECREQ